MKEKIYTVVYSRLVFDGRKLKRENLTEAELKDLLCDKSKRKYVVHLAKLNNLEESHE